MGSIERTLSISKNSGLYPDSIEPTAVNTSYLKRLREILVNHCRSKLPVGLIARMTAVDFNETHHRPSTDAFCKGREKRGQTHATPHEKNLNKASKSIKVTIG